MKLAFLLVMVQPPFFPFSSLSPFVCALPHLHHLLTPSDLVHLPSTTSTPTPRCTHATMLHIELDLSRMRRQLSSHFYSGKVPPCIYFDLYIITLLLRHSAGTHSP